MLLLLIIGSTNCGFTITLLPLLPAIFSLSITFPDSYSKLALLQEPLHIQAQIFQLYRQNFLGIFPVSDLFACSTWYIKNAEEDLHGHLPLHASN